MMVAFIFPKTKRQKDKGTKRQKPKREFNMAISGQLCTLAMCLFKFFIDKTKLKILNPLLNGERGYLAI